MNKERLTVDHCFRRGENIKNKLVYEAGTGSEAREGNDGAGETRGRMLILEHNLNTTRHVEEPGVVAALRWAINGRTMVPDEYPKTSTSEPRNCRATAICST